MWSEILQILWLTVEQWLNRWSWYMELEQCLARATLYLMSVYSSKILMHSPFCFTIYSGRQNMCWCHWVDFVHSSLSSVMLSVCQNCSHLACLSATCPSCVMSFDCRITVQLWIHTQTDTHPFNGPLSRTTRVSRYQNGKTNLDFY